VNFDLRMYWDEEDGFFDRLLGGEDDFLSRFRVLIPGIGSLYGGRFPFLM